MTRPKVIQLGGGLLMIETAKTFRAEGYELHILDRDPNAPAAPYADAFAPVDISDEKAVYEYAARIGADAVIPVNDAGARSAAFAAEKLGLPHNPYEVVCRATDKGLMRLAWQAAGVPQPNFRIFTDMAELPAMAAEIGFPCVLKPCLNWGAKGVSVLHGPEDIPFASSFTLEHARNNRYIVEEFIGGTEMNVEGLVRGEELNILIDSDKVLQDHPKYRVTFQVNYSASLPQHIRERVRTVVTAAAKALGLRLGALHAECMVRGEDVYMVEMAARPGGGHVFSLIVGAASGVDMPRALAKLYLQRPVDITKKWERGVVYRFFAPPPGVFRGVNGMEAARQMPGVLALGFDLAPGTTITVIEHGAARPGFLVVEGQDRAEAVRRTEAALGSLNFDVAPIPAETINA